MGFLAPLLLVGTLGVAVPIAIHLFGRRRARVVRFAALDFLFQSNRKTARRMQIRERALLFVRGLVCLAIPLALAKPYTACHRDGPAIARGAQAAVLVIDNSFASALTHEAGTTWLRRATASARQVLAQLGPEAEIAIVTTARAQERTTELTRDHLRLRDALIGMVSSAEPGDTRRALAQAAALLATSSHRQKTVFLFSLNTLAALPAGAPVWGADGPQLEVIDVPVPARNNRAIAKLSVTPDTGAGARGIAISAEILNASDEPATNLAVAVRIDGSEVARGNLDLAPHERKHKRFLAMLPKGREHADIEVQIPNDALAIDNVRMARVALRADVRVLLVNGDPRTVRRDDELFYIETALRPGDRIDSGITLATVAADEFTASSLNDTDVVVLANVPALPTLKADALASWVRAGGGLAVAVGDHVAAQAYARTMAPLLPQPLGDIVDVTWGAASEERSARALHFDTFATNHPIFSAFAADAPALRTASFYKVMLLAANSAQPQTGRTVLAHFTNGAPALIENALGLGRILLYTSTLDRDWNDLAIFPGYLPLWQQVIRHLARRPSAPADDDVLAGESVELAIRGAAKLEVRGPAANATFDRERLVTRHTVRFSDTHTPGWYSVRAWAPDGTAIVGDDQGFAVNIDARGSDLTPAPAAHLPASGAAHADRATPNTERVELWHAIAALLLLLLLAEGLLLQRA